MLEAKIADPRAFAKWDPYPAYYAAQVQWNMDCCGVDRAVLCVLVGDWTWHAYTIAADPVVQSTLRGASRVVWDAAKAGDLLGLVDFDHPKTPAALLALYPGGVADAGADPLAQLDDPELVGACIEIERIQAEQAALKADRATAENTATQSRRFSVRNTAATTKGN